MYGYNINYPFHGFDPLIVQIYICPIMFDSVPQTAPIFDGIIYDTGTSLSEIDSAHENAKLVNRKKMLSKLLRS